MGQLSSSGTFTATPEVALAAFDNYAVKLKGEELGAPATLLDFQRDYVRKIYTRNPDGSRRYKKVFICGPKKIGKSFVFGHLCVFELTLLGKPGGDVYAIASSFQQGEEIFKPAATVAKHSPKLQPLDLQIRSATQEIRFPAFENKVRVLSTDVEKLHGKAPRLLVVDELHAIHDRRSFDNVAEGMGVWESIDPVDGYLVVLVSNWGEIGSSPAFWDELRYARRVQQDPDFDPTYCAMISEPPPDIEVDELLKSPKVWYDFHDGLRGGLITEQFLQSRAHEAEMTPSLKNTIVRLHFCKPTSAESAAFNMPRYDECVDPEFSIEELFGRECFAGLDLAANTDLAAFGLIFPEGEVEVEIDLEDEDERLSLEELMPGATRVLPKFAVYVQFWVPEERVIPLEQLTERPLREWVKKGHLLTTKGDTINDKVIEMHVRKAFETFNLRACGTDPKFASRLFRELTDDGLPMVKLRQTSETYTEPWRSIESAYMSGRARLHHSPVLRWNAESLMLRIFHDDGILPGKIERSKDTRRIDGWAAAAMAEYCRIKDFGVANVEGLYL